MFKRSITLFGSLALLFACVGNLTAQNIMESVEVLKLYEKNINIKQVPVITCIDLDQSGKLLALGGDDHTVRLWDLERRTFFRELQQHKDWVRGLAFSSDHSRLATIGQDGQIKLWNVDDGSLVQTVSETARGMQKIVFHPEGTQFAVCGFDNVVRLYDAKTGNRLGTLTAPANNNRAIAYSPDGNYLAVGGRTGVVRIWSRSNGLFNTKQAIDVQGDGRRVNALAFDVTNTKLVVGGDGPFITFWDAKSGKLIDRLPERPGKTYSLVFCGENYLASGESDNAIRLWDLQNKQNIATLLGHTGTISSMVYDTENSRLISGSFDTSIRFWEMTNLSKGRIAKPEVPPAIAFQPMDSPQVDWAPAISESVAGDGETFFTEPVANEPVPVFAMPPAPVF